LDVGRGRGQLVVFNKVLGGEAEERSQLLFVAAAGPAVAPASFGDKRGELEVRVVATMDIQFDGGGPHILRRILRAPDWNVKAGTRIGAALPIHYGPRPIPQAGYDYGLALAVHFDLTGKGRYSLLVLVRTFVRPRTRFRGEEGGGVESKGMERREVGFRSLGGGLFGHMKKHNAL
jgi:hypothetical protein